MKFKVGDKVRIIGVPLGGKSVNWVTGMDCTLGNEETLKHDPDGDFFPWAIGEWWYCEDWLELVENATSDYDRAMEIV